MSTAFSVVLSGQDLGTFRSDRQQSGTELFVLREKIIINIVVLKQFGKQTVTLASPQQVCAWHMQTESLMTSFYQLRIIDVKSPAWRTPVRIHKHALDINNRSLYSSVLYLPNFNTLIHCLLVPTPI